jgi:hypothetical protein
MSQALHIEADRNGRQWTTSPPPNTAHGLAWTAAKGSHRTCNWKASRRFSLNNGRVSESFVLAGYRLVTRFRCPDGFHNGGLLPDELVTISECLADMVSVDEVGWDDWFADRPTAERARPVVGDTAHRALAVGIHQGDVAGLLADIADGGWDVSAGSLPERLAERLPFPPVEAADALGFELLGYDCGTWHTWTCLGDLVEDVHQATGVRPGAWGLLQHYGDARTAADFLTRSGLGDPKVFLWVPALLAGPTPPSDYQADSNG